MEMGPKNNVEHDTKADPELETLAVPRPRRSLFLEEWQPYGTPGIIHFSWDFP